MRLRGLILAATLALATPAGAEKWYGALVNAASGARLPAAFEIVDGESLSYCFNDLEANCWLLPYVLLEGGVIQARLLVERKNSAGEDLRQTNIWTWTPTEGGYHGRFEIQYDDDPPELQTEGAFGPKP